MATILDLSGLTPYYSQSVDLDNSTFTLTFQYRTRDDSWTVSIEDNTGATVIDGVKLVAGGALLQGVVAANRPVGELVCVDSTNKDLDPGLNDFSGDNPRCYVGYLEAADLGR